MRARVELNARRNHVPLGIELDQADLTGIVPAPPGPNCVMDTVIGESSETSVDVVGGCHVSRHRIRSVEVVVRLVARVPKVAKVVCDPDADAGATRLAEIHR